MKTLAKLSANPLLSLGLSTLLALSSCSNKHLVSIGVTPANPTVSQVGQTLQFQATGTTNHPNAGTEVLTSSATWSSSNPSVATIDKNGLATATGCGQTTITAQDGNVMGQTALTSSCGGSGGGNPVLQSVNIYPNSPTIPQVGQTTQFIALGAYAPASTNNNLTSVATWASSDVGVATISGTGLASAVACGQTTITAIYQGVLGSAQLTVACSVPQNPVLQSVSLYPSGPVIPQLGQTTQFIALAVYSPATGNNIVTNSATWASSNPSIATISASGLATAAGCGATTITAGYLGVIGQMPLTVQCTGSQTLQSIAVSPQNPTIPLVGQTTQFAALGSLVQGGQTDLTATATWFSSNAQVATVNSSGMATSVNCGTSTISAEYQSVIGQSVLTVSCAPVVTSVELLILKTGSTLGTVVSSPAGIDCGTVCGSLFNEGTGFTLTAVPTPLSWSGCDQSIGGACYFTLMPDAGGTSKTITVNF